MTFLFKNVIRKSGLATHIKSEQLIGHLLYMDEHKTCGKSENDTNSPINIVKICTDDIQMKSVEDITQRGKIKSLEGRQFEIWKNGKKKYLGIEQREENIQTEVRINI